MKTKPILHHLGAINAALIVSSAIPATAAITVDGTRDTGTETEYTEKAVQTQTTGWGTGNAIANLHSVQSGKLLNLFIAGRANGNAIILFIDSKSGGVSNLTNDLIRSGGFESDINNLGTSNSAGMTFESGFQPDYAIRIYGNGTDAYASIFDLAKRIRVDLGQVDDVNGSTASHGPVAQLRASWADVGANSSTYASAVKGVEMSLNMALLGVPEGSNDVKMMAILVNGDSTYGSNQALGSLSNSTDMGGGVNAFNFETESGTQTLTVSVNRPALVGGDDEDGDGIINSSDPLPLDPTRDIAFSVNMNVEYAKGYFDPPSSVQVQFFTGSETPLSTLTLTDPDQDLIYTGTLTDSKGFAGDSFGTYKFITDDPQNTNSGYETGLDRSFNLGAAGTTQTLGTVFFSNESTLSFTAWAAANASGQLANQDSDSDGVANGVEYFMGATGSSFTPNPPPVANLISWPRSPYATGVTFKVWSSDNLSTWTDVTGSADTSNPAFVKYTLPTGDPKRFVRLEVAVP
jgi:hypothetical protein